MSDDGLYRGGNGGRRKVRMHDGHGNYVNLPDMKLTPDGFRWADEGGNVPETPTTDAIQANLTKDHEDMVLHAERLETALREILKLSTSQAQTQMITLKAIEELARKALE